MLVRILAILLSACAGVAPAFAQMDRAGQTTFPGWAPTDAMVRIQEKADAAFEAGKYRKALWLYSKELAPVGDKYGQYMVAYMHEKGLGIARDPVQAGAWYALAAERGHEPIVAAAETFQKSLRPGQLASARALAASLREQWGDKALVQRAIERDIARLNEMAGSRIRSTRRRSCGARPGRVYIGMTSMSFQDFCEVVNDRIDLRMAYLEGYVTYGELELLPDEEEEDSDAGVSGTDE